MRNREFFAELFFRLFQQYRQLAFAPVASFLNLAIALNGFRLQFAPPPFTVSRCRLSGCASREYRFPFSSSAANSSFVATLKTLPFSIATDLIAAVSNKAAAHYVSISTVGFLGGSGRLAVNLTLHRNQTPSRAEFQCHHPRTHTRWRIFKEQSHITLPPISYAIL